MADSKEVALKQNNALALASMFEEDSGAGFENADRDSYSIPFISILQSGSPQVKKSDGAYIKGAEEGFLFNSVSQEIIDGGKGITVIPAYFTRRFLEWVPRDSGGSGGLVGEHLPSDELVTTAQRDAKNQLVLPSGNILVDTRTHYVLVLSDDLQSFAPALISMSSTQVKKSRQWMTRMESLKAKNAQGLLFTPPMFSHSYKLTTVPEQNDQGSWYGWKIEAAGAVTDANLYQAAKSFRDAVKTGEAKPSAPATQQTDADIPF
jgi:hypothetical protein